MSVGYSGTPLPKKLGMPLMGRVLIVGAPANFFDLIGRLPPAVELARRPSRDLAYVHLFATRRKRLASELARLAPYLRKDGMLWVSWPKKSSGVASDVTEDVVREVALPMGLVDVKVCAVDEVWSGLKLVYRLKNR